MKGGPAEQLAIGMIAVSREEKAPGRSAGIRRQVALRERCRRRVVERVAREPECRLLRR